MNKFSIFIIILDLDNPLIYEMFEKAETVFGYNLIDVCLNGPSVELNKTKYLLPCVFLANHTGILILFY